MPAKSSAIWKRLRAKALSLPEAHEDFPWGDCVAKVGKKIFVFLGNGNTDGTAWMYAVADLHPLWTHYDYPQQTGPGYNRYIFWAYADADALPRISNEVRALVPEAIRALNIRYILTSAPTVRGFKVPDGLLSIDQSKWWAKIYDDGEAWIYEWRGAPPTPRP